MEIVDDESATDTALAVVEATDGAITPIRGERGRLLPGVVLNPRGRQKGSINYTTREAKEACAQIVDDPAYRANLHKRAIQGKLKPQLEVLLWHYAKGVPRVEIDLNAKVMDVSKMATDELREELAALIGLLQ